MRTLNIIERKKYKSFVLSAVVISTFLSCSRDKKIQANTQDKKIDHALLQPMNQPLQEPDRISKGFVFDEGSIEPQALDFNFLFDQNGEPLVSYMRLTDSRYPQFQWLYLLDSTYFASLDSENKKQLSNKNIDFQQMNVLLAKNRDLEYLRRKVSILQRELASLSSNHLDCSYVLNQKFLAMSKASLENMKSNISNHELNQWIDLASKSASVQDSLSLNIMFDWNETQFQMRESGSNPFLKSFSTEQEEQDYIRGILFKSFHPNQSVSYLDAINFMARNSLEPKSNSRLANAFQEWLQKSLELIDKMSFQEKEKLDTRKTIIQGELQKLMEDILRQEENLKLLVEEMYSKN